MINILGVRLLIAGAFFFIFSFFFTGCASVQPAFAPSSFSNLPVLIEIPKVPFHKQEKYQCGPATLAMSLNWSGIDVTPESLIPQVFSPERQGSLQTEIIGAARRYGRLPYPIYGVDALLKEISAGHPVIVLQNLTFNWAPTWHYALVFGFNRESSTIIMHSGVTQRYLVDWTVFVKTWKRGGFWGLLTLPQGVLPESASEESYLKAVLGLEQVKDWASASVAYKAALGRWTESLAAVMGNGNSLYALGDLQGAEKAFRKAVKIAPDNGITHNNLAHVLSQQGKYQAAMESILLAIEAGGAKKDLFELTFREIKEKMDQNQ